MDLGRIAWKPTQLAPLSDEDRVDVWRIRLGEFHPQTKNLLERLAPEEVERANRFVFDHDRRDFVAGRAILRSLLGGYLGVRPAEIVIHGGPRGKPQVLQLTKNKHVIFNVSHSYGLCIMGFRLTRQLGIDVEKLRENVAIHDIAARFLAPEESRWLGELSSDEQTAGFFSIWTKKEALVKAIGEGLHLPLDRFHVHVTTQPFNITGRDGRIWVIRTFTPECGYLAALATEGSEELRVQYFDYRE